jgi:hypothetical protein
VRPNGRVVEQQKVHWAETVGYGFLLSSLRVAKNKFTGASQVG